MGPHETLAASGREIYFTTLSLISHKYLVSYDRYFQSKLNEPIIERFEWELYMQFHEHCATSAKTMFSQYHTFRNNFYINRCGFSFPTKQFYFHWKRVETSDDMNFLNFLNLFILRNFRSTKNTWDKNFRKFCSNLDFRQPPANLPSDSEVVHQTPTHSLTEIVLVLWHNHLYLFVLNLKFWTISYSDCQNLQRQLTFVWLWSWNFEISPSATAWSYLVLGAEQ
jgi:hypothetical protein